MKHSRHTLWPDTTPYCWSSPIKDCLYSNCWVISNVMSYYLVQGQRTSHQDPRTTTTLPNHRHAEQIGRRRSCIRSSDSSSLTMKNDRITGKKTGCSKEKSVIFKCHSSEKLTALNILHEGVPTWYLFHSCVDWSNAHKLSCSRTQHTDADSLCIQKPSFLLHDHMTNM